MDSDGPKSYRAQFLYFHTQTHMDSGLKLYSLLQVYNMFNQTKQLNLIILIRKNSGLFTKMGVLKVHDHFFVDELPELWGDLRIFLICEWTLLELHFEKLKINTLNGLFYTLLKLHYTGFFC